MVKPGKNIYLLCWEYSLTIYFDLITGKPPIFTMTKIGDAHSYFDVF